MYTSSAQEFQTNLESRIHFAFFLAIDQTVVILHRDKWCKFVLDGVVYVASGQRESDI